MRAPIHDASARRDPGGPSLVLGRGGDRNNRPRNPGMAELEDEIARLVDRSTHELRLAWRKLHRTGPALGLSRDLMIRTFANKLATDNAGPRARTRPRARGLYGCVRATDALMLCRSSATANRTSERFVVRPPAGQPPRVPFDHRPRQQRRAGPLLGP